MTKYIILLMLLTSVYSSAQYNSFKVLENGDTLNRLDNKNLKQGRWKIHVNALRIDPAYDEEGEFINDKKEGVWRKYDIYGLLVAKENYKWGNKHGLQQYLNEGRLEREESWRSIDPKQQFDTIDVQDVIDDYKFEKKIIKIESYSVEHGTWRYFDPETGRLLKTVEYLFGKLYTPTKKEVVASIDTIPKIKPKPQAVLDFEKSNRGKKSIKVRGGNTGY